MCPPHALQHQQLSAHWQALTGAADADIDDVGSLEGRSSFLASTPELLDRVIPLQGAICRTSIAVCPSGFLPDWHRDAAVGSGTRTRVDEGTVGGLLAIPLHTALASAQVTARPRQRFLITLMCWCPEAEGSWMGPHLLMIDLGWTWGPCAP